MDDFNSYGIEVEMLVNFLLNDDLNRHCSSQNEAYIDMIPVGYLDMIPEG